MIFQHPVGSREKGLVLMSSCCTALLYFIYVGFYKQETLEKNGQCNRSLTSKATTTWSTISMLFQRRHRKVSTRGRQWRERLTAWFAHPTCVCGQASERLARPSKFNLSFDRFHQPCPSSTVSFKQDKGNCYLKTPYFNVYSVVTQYTAPYIVHSK